MKLEDFLKILHTAVNYASDSLMKNNLELFETYFNKSKSSQTNEEYFTPKTIKMDYPVVGENNSIEQKQLEVPLITLVPVRSSKIEKATFNFEFQIDEKDDNVSVSFNKGVFGNGANCKMELTIVPDENPNGIDCLIDKYNKILDNQG